MLPSKKYIKKSIKQGVITTILLGIIPFSFSLGLDIFAAVNNESHELINFNNMMSSLLPTNHTYINILIWLSAIYTISLFFIVIMDKNFKRKIIATNWLKNFILNFEPALSTIFSFMFIASSTFFTLGVLLNFSNLGISYGLGFILFCIPTLALAGMLELKDSFLQQ